MATIKNIKRYLWLLETLYTFGPITRDQINEIWKKNMDSNGKDIPRRSLARHFAEIETLFNITINCNDKYQYYISNPSNLHHQTMQSQLLSNLQEATFLSRFRGLGTKIQVEEINAGTSYLPIIGEALDENRTLQMTYQKFTDTEPYTVEIEPYCLKLRDRRWYIIARKETDENVKVFSLDRINRLELTDHTFTPDTNFDPDTFFQNYYGIFVESEAEVEDVVIKATPLQAKYLRTLPLHKSQQETADCQFHYRLVITPDFKNELFKIVDNIIVIEPQHLKEEIMQRIRKIINEW